MILVHITTVTWKENKIKNNEHFYLIHLLNCSTRCSQAAFPLTKKNCKLELQK